MSAITEAPAKLAGAPDFASANRDVLREWMVKAGMPYSFRTKRGVQKYLRPETMRYRLAEVKAGRGPEWWFSSSHSDEEKAAAETEPEPEPAREPEPVRPGPALPADSDATVLLRRLIEMSGFKSDAALDAAAVERIVGKIVDAKLNAIPPREIVVKLPDGSVNKVGGIKHEAFDRVLKLVSIGVHVWLVGPAGTGKTTLAEQVAEGLGLEFSSYSCSGGLSSGDLLGRFMPTGEGGKFQRSESAFIKRYRDGGLVLLDEIDSADPSVLLVLNSALANGGMEVEGHGYIKRHEKFRIVAAANTFGSGADAQYVGRNRLDAATLDRFAGGYVQLDYSPRIESSGSIDIEILSWGRKLREKIAQHKIRRIVSTRGLIALTKLVRAEVDTIDSAKSVFLATWTPEERRLVGE